MQEIKRTYINEEGLDEPPAPPKGPFTVQQIYVGDPPKPPVEVDPEFANLITSITDDGMHAPCIDLDFPCELYPSSQLGHYHLYLNKAITWTAYKQVLNAMTAAGLVEVGYTQASIARGYSSLRPIGQVKPGGVPTTKKLLIETAQLRRQNFELRQALEDAQRTIAELQPEPVHTP